jgi:hypothetical protein
MPEIDVLSASAETIPDPTDDPAETESGSGPAEDSAS